ncbi:MAG: FUSC family protein, partial [Gammaproteobacteria bacterium]|nr:FUSC family protein [Gammaproteobacteria bacterium]
VKELRPVWDRLLTESKALMTSVDQWQTSLGELQTVQVHKVLPDIDSYFAAICQHLSNCGAIWDGAVNVEPVAAVKLRADAGEAKDLSHFDQAALRVAASHLERIAAVAGKLCGHVNNLNSAQTYVRINSEHKERAGFGFVPDPDRIRASLYIVVVTCTAFMAWVYFDPPGHASVWSMSPIIGFVAALTPHMRVGVALLKPFIIYLPVSMLLYIFVMPALSGYTELGLMIFAFIFWTQYSLNNPLAATTTILGFLSVIKIENQQTYSFVSIASSYLFMLICTLIVIAASYVLLSPNPEKMFVRLLRRYFKSADYMLGSMADLGRGQKGVLARWRQEFHGRQLSALPGKLQVWGAQIDHSAFPANNVEQVNALIASLQGLNYRMNELLALKDLPQSDYLAEELSAAIKEWRQVIQAGFGRLLVGESPGEAAQLSTKLDQRLEHLEQTLNVVMESTAAASLTDADRDHAYRLLGGYRGLANAAINWLGCAEQVDWAQWREARFS